MGGKGKVTHVLYNPNNPEHQQIAENVGVGVTPKSVLQGKTGAIIQYYDGVPSGSISFFITPEHKRADITHIYVKPEFRDTREMTEEEAGEVNKKRLESKRKEIWQRHPELTRRYAEDLTGRDASRMRSIYRTGAGLKKNRQRFLGVKLVKSVNTLIGFEPYTVGGSTPQGVRHLEKFGKNSKSFFKAIRRRR